VINYLDIPTNDDGTSQYPGPYTATDDQQALFDAAVTCDGNTITYNLKQPVADFNYTVTLGLAAVPNPTDHEGIDTKENYTNAPWSDGPYMIKSFDSNVGGSLILERNPNWDASVDDYREANPDTWQVDFLGDAKVEDQRLMASQGDDAFAIQYGAIQPENLTTVFSDAHTVNADFEGRAFSDFDPYSRYYWINLNKVPDLNVRQAMAVALNRDAIRTNIGGEFAGDFADGVIKPNIGQDYAPTNLWTASGPYQEDVPAAGDPAKATELLAGATPTVTFDYATSPTNDQTAAIVKDSLEQAGFKVKLNPIDPTHYYSTVQNPDTQDEFGTAGWGPDWPNASTVIPPLFTKSGGFDLSGVDATNNADFTNQVTDALGTLDRAEQATKWQNLNKTAAEQVFVIPTFFGLAQTMAGNGIGNLYRWSAYGSWDYGVLYVNQAQ
jgi:peptide/nickel transport system substrate-binding protein